MNKVTKRNIIISSILAIMLCVSLMAGATFALFTSESKVNIAVSSGKVDVVATIDNTLELSHKEWNVTTGMYEEAEGLFAGSNAILDVDAQTLTIEKMAPMDKISFDVKVKNNSNIQALYRTIISCVNDNGLFSGLSIKIDGVEYLGNKLISEYKELAPTATEEVINVCIELPADAGNEYQDMSCSISYKVEAIQGNAYNGVYEVTPENAQSVLDKIEGDATIVLTEGNYEKLYIRQNLETSTRRTDLDINAQSYPAYYRSFKDVTIKAKEGANVTCDGVNVEAGLFHHTNAPASNNDVMHENSGFISYLELENVTIDGITFNDTSSIAVLLGDNKGDPVKGSALSVDGLMVKNCKGTGDTANLLVYFLCAGSGSNDEEFLNTGKKGLNNIMLVNNEINSYYQPIHFNNSSAVLNNLMVKGNKFTDCIDNILMVSNKINDGKFIISDNTITNMNGRFIRLANAQATSSFTFKNNEIITPVKYDVDKPEVVKITGTDGFKVYESGNNWEVGSFVESAKYISNGNVNLLPDGTYGS